MLMFSIEIACTINGNFLEAIKYARRCGVINFGNNKVININNKDTSTIDVINAVLLSVETGWGVKLFKASSSKIFSGRKGEFVIPS